MHHASRVAIIVTIEPAVVEHKVVHLRPALEGARLAHTLRVLAFQSRERRLKGLTRAMRETPWAPRGVQDGVKLLHVACNVKQWPGAGCFSPTRGVPRGALWAPGLGAHPPTTPMVCMEGVDVGGRPDFF